MKFIKTMGTKLQLGFILVLAIIGFALYSAKQTQSVEFQQDLDDIKYWNIQDKEVLQLGRSIDWEKSRSIPFMLAYAEAIHKTQQEVPSGITSKFPSVYEFVAGYNSVRSGHISTAKKHFKKLQEKPLTLAYGYIGMLDLYTYTGNTTALCDSVKSYEKSNKFSEKYSLELLMDYKLKCMAGAGDVKGIKKVLGEYKPNDINDKFKKNLALINMLNLIGEFEESKKIINDTKSWYGTPDDLIASEADLVLQMNGDEEAAKFLEKYIRDEAYFLKEIYAIYLSNSVADQSERAFSILADNMYKQPHDVLSKLMLAHYAFNAGSRKYLDEAFALLNQINDIGEFSSFNLLEAKMALHNNNHTETNKKLKQVEEKSPLDGSYLWFSYQYNDLIGEKETARLFLKKYLITDPNNKIVKDVLIGY